VIFFSVVYPSRSQSRVAGIQTTWPLWLPPSVVLRREFHLISLHLQKKMSELNKVKWEPSILIIIPRFFVFQEESFCNKSNKGKTCQSFYHTYGQIKNLYLLWWFNYTGHTIFEWFLWKSLYLDCKVMQF